jgi:mRNA interferase MazF
MKNFDEWNKIKKDTERNSRKIGIKPRDIFWAKIGENVGFEQNGKGENFARPVIILRKLTSELFLGIPLTSTIKDGDYFHTFEYINHTNGLVQNTALVLQMKVFSIRRLMNKTGVINKDDFETIVEKSKRLISPT